MGGQAWVKSDHTRNTQGSRVSSEDVRNAGLQCEGGQKTGEWTPWMQGACDLQGPAGEQVPHSPSLCWAQRAEGLLSSCPKGGPKGTARSHEVCGGLQVERSPTHVRSVTPYTGPSRFTRTPTHVRCRIRTHVRSCVLLRGRMFQASTCLGEGRLLRERRPPSLHNTHTCSSVQPSIGSTASAAVPQSCTAGR